jgi:hypothetical protein
VILVSGGVLDVQCRCLAGTVVVAPHGVLDLVGYGVLRDALLKVGVDEPRAVIVDLGELLIPDQTTMALFTWVAEQLDRWPGVPLLVSAPHEEQRVLFNVSRVNRFVPIHSSVDNAVAAVDEPRLRRVIRQELPNSARSVGVARQLVRDVCEWWGLDWIEPVIIANELVENTLMHTFYAPSVRLELRRGMLTVAVYDDDPARPLPEELWAGPELRLGLRIVAGLAAGWGSAPTPSGGKVVWAVVKG